MAIPIADISMHVIALCGLEFKPTEVRTMLTDADYSCRICYAAHSRRGALGR